MSSRSKPAAPEEVHSAFHDVGPDGWGKSVLQQAFPELTLGMPEFLALGSSNRTGDLAFGPTPDGPASWCPDQAPLIDLPSADDDIEALMTAAEAVDRGSASRHHMRRLLRASDEVVAAVHRFPDFLDARNVSRADRSLLAGSVSPLIDTR